MGSLVTARGEEMGRGGVTVVEGGGGSVYQKLDLKEKGEGAEIFELTSSTGVQPFEIIVR
jgi:hypothetical protein